MAAVEDANDKNIEQWKIKKLIKSLEAARGYYKRSFYGTDVYKCIY